MSDQSQFFLKGEGDAWFKRNFSVIKNTEGVSQDLTCILQHLKSSRFNIGNILEVGCSSAEKLNFLASEFNASGAGIDPSKMAIEYASNLYPHLDLHVGLASSLPFDPKSFDLVFLAFCLYLIPQEEVELAIMEALRVLRPSGFIALTDFDPGFDTSLPYHHVDGLFSYKRDYLKIFRSFSNITLVAKHSYSHSSEFFVFDSNERVSTQIFFVQ